MIQRLQLVAELQFSVQAAQLLSIRVEQLQVIIAQANIQIADNAGQLVIQRNAVRMRFNVLADFALNFVSIFFRRFFFTKRR